MLIRRGMWMHLTARAYRYDLPLTADAIAPIIWSSLRRAFANVAAVLLMPNHFHLEADEDEVAAARCKLAHVLAGVRRADGSAGALRWEPVEDPRVLPDRKHHARDSRYILLNPCRADIVDDPLAWKWSTLRDIVGAVDDPWVTAPRLADVLGWARQDFPARFHRYVSADPSVAVVGTKPPVFPEPTLLAIEPLADVLAAAAAALRCTPKRLIASRRGRTLLVQLAAQRGWRSTSLLASLGIPPRSVRWYRSRPPDAALGAATLCLGDARLRRDETRAAHDLCRKAAATGIVVALQP